MITLESTGERPVERAEQATTESPPPKLAALRLCRVTPGGDFADRAWIGRIVDPRYSEMGMALRHAQDDARRDPRPGVREDDYVIVRCVDAGGQVGLDPGTDYLVLRRFVQAC